MTYNLTIETDAYHMTMGGRLITNPMEIETHVLYARSGGPQVIGDLSETLRRITQSVPTVSQVAESEKFWRTQQIPFASDVWYKFTQSSALPFSVRGVRDGEVVMPGDPIAVITGPAALAGAIEPLIIGEQMASMQLATRFIKTATAVKGATNRIFEVGLRAVDGSDEHIKKLSRIKRMGLKATSSGKSAKALKLKTIGTMGHRYTQRFTGSDADYKAFTNAIEQMVAYRKEIRSEVRLPLSFLIDTRSTLDQGLPAAIKAINDNWQLICENLFISVRLDSGDLRAQFRIIANTFLKEFGVRDYMPGIIVESGLTATDVADFEAIADEVGFDRNLVFYGLGGYLVGGIDRDWVSLVYKITSFGGSDISDVRDLAPTMKFGDEPQSGKESYPGNFSLWESDTRERVLALEMERQQMDGTGWNDLFTDLVVNGRMTPASFQTDEQASARAMQRWQEVTNSYLMEEKLFTDSDNEIIRRPQYSPGVTQLVGKLRQVQFAA